MTRDPAFELGKRERQIMDIVYRRGRATASEVLADLPDPPDLFHRARNAPLPRGQGPSAPRAGGARYVYLRDLAEEGGSRLRAVASRQDLFRRLGQQPRSPLCSSRSR